MADKYIKLKDAINRAYELYGESDFIRAEELSAFVKSIPAADVVEVVRCKGCVYHYYAVDGAGMCKLGIGNALLDDDFCSRGIRKGGAKMEVQNG